MNDLQTIKSVSCCRDDRDKGLSDIGSDKNMACTDYHCRYLFLLFTHGTSASHKVISDLKADDSEQYEGRQEGVEHKKVQGVAGGSSWVKLVYNNIAVFNQAFAWEIHRFV